MKITKYIDEITSLLNTQEKQWHLLKTSGLFGLIFLALYWIGSFIPEGFDWKHYFQLGIIHPIWTPWSKYIVNFLSPLGFGFVFALSVIGLGLRTFRYSKSPIPLALALFSLPTLWVFWMGNLDGLVLFGMLIMPIGIPLVLMKPQVSAFILLSRRDWFLAGGFWFLVSLVIWGFWPINLLMVTTPQWKTEWVQDISIFPWGLLIGVPLMWFSRGDQDLLMAAGSLITPHLFPYHFIILMPSLARMRWYWMLLTWIISWTPLLANWLGPLAWHFGIY
ncbi:MAG: hypothetical protein WCG34_10270 [Leptolinea sp.]